MAAGDDHRRAAHACGPAEHGAPRSLPAAGQQLVLGPLRVSRAADPAQGHGRLPPVPRVRQGSRGPGRLPVLPQHARRRKAGRRRLPRHARGRSGRRRAALCRSPAAKGHRHGDGRQPAGRPVPARQIAGLGCRAAIAAAHRQPARQAEAGAQPDLHRQHGHPEGSRENASDLPSHRLSLERPRGLSGGQECCRRDEPR